MRINSNSIVQQSYSQYARNTSTIVKSVAKLSSGSAINAASDNAAGLAISEKMKAQIRGLNKAASNAQDAISLIQVAESALGDTEAILERMGDICMQAANEALTEGDRQALKDEFKELTSELDDIASNTMFNKKTLLDGSCAYLRKNVENSNFSENGLSVDLGNVPDGHYEFGVSVSDGCVYATLTGGERVKLEAGMSSATFSNGVTVNFETLTAADVSPTYADMGRTLALNGFDPSVYIGGATITAGAYASATTMPNQDYTFTVKTEGATKGVTITAVGASDGKIFTSTVAGFGTTSLAQGSVLSFDFGADAFTLDLTVGSSGLTNLTNQLANAYNAITRGLNGATITASNSAINTRAASAAVSYQAAGNISGISIIAGDETKTASYTFEPYFISDGFMNTVAHGSDGMDLYGNFNATDPLAAGTYSINFSQQFGGEGGTAFALNVTTASAYDGDNKADNLTAFKNDLFAALKGVTTVGAIEEYVPKADTIKGYNYQRVFGDSATGSGSTAYSFDVTSVENEGLKFNLGSGEDDYAIEFHIDSMDSNSLGLSACTLDSMSSSMDTYFAVSSALGSVTSQRASLGGVVNCIEAHISSLEIQAEMISSAHSAIKDIDMANEMVSLKRKEHRGNAGYFIA